MAKILASDSITLVRVDDGAQGTQGINLILQSGIEYSNSNYPTHIYDLSEDIDPNETYTITLWGELGEGKTAFQAFIGGDYNRFPPNKEIATGKYQITGKLSISSGHENDRKDKLYVYPVPNSVTGKISTIHRVKLERGSVPDPVWAPSPLDADTKIEEFRLTVDKKLDEFQHTEDEFRSQLSEVTTTVTAAKADVEAAKERLDGTEKSIADAEGRLDGLDATVESLDSKTSKIEQQAGSIELSVQEVTEKATQLGTDISSAQSSIKQLSDSITNKVSKDDFNSEVKQLSDSITNKVSKGDLSSEISQEAGAINIKSNRLTVDSDKFKLSADGTVKAENVDLSGEFETVSGDFRTRITAGKLAALYKNTPTFALSSFQTNGGAAGALALRDTSEGFVIGESAADTLEGPIVNVSPLYTVHSRKEQSASATRHEFSGAAEFWNDIHCHDVVQADNGFEGNLDGKATSAGKADYASYDEKGRGITSYVASLSLQDGKLQVQQGSGSNYSLTLPTSSGSTSLPKQIALHADGMYPTIFSNSTLSGYDYTPVGGEILIAPDANAIYRYHTYSGKVARVYCYQPRRNGVTVTKKGEYMGAVMGNFTGYSSNTVPITGSDHTNLGGDNFVNNNNSLLRGSPFALVASFTMSSPWTSHDTIHNYITSNLSKFPLVSLGADGIDDMLIIVRAEIKLPTSGTTNVCSTFIDNGGAVFVGDTKRLDYWAAGCWYNQNTYFLGPQFTGDTTSRTWTVYNAEMDGGAGMNLYAKIGSIYYNLNNYIQSASGGEWVYEAPLADTSWNIAIEASSDAIKTVSGDSNLSYQTLDMYAKPGDIHIKTPSNLLSALTQTQIWRCKYARFGQDKQVWEKIF